MSMMHVKKNDTVVVISGKDKDKRGEILSVDPVGNKILVKGVSIVVRHLKARRSGEKPSIRKQESFICASKAVIVCPACDKASRMAHVINEKGVKARLCKKCQVVW